MLFLIFPTWALPVSINARAGVFFGLITYFGISAILMNRWLTAFSINKPVIVWESNWKECINNNLWLVIVCSIAVVLHIAPITRPILILGDENIHIAGGLWIYQYIDISWHHFLQKVFWAIIVFVVISRKTKIFARGIIKNIIDKIFILINKNALKFLYVLLGISFLVIYFILLKDIAYYQHTIRYPPVSKFLYFGSYLAFGINRISPRVVQLFFYLCTAIYLYRTIYLFHEKEAALIGATIYLFLPISFAYAHLAELASGTIFFIVATSFYFLSFLKKGEDRNLLIAAYLIGTGCLYKKLNLLLFIICGTFLIIHIIRKKNFYSLIHFKILSLSLVSIIPWMFLSKNYSWRNYDFVLSNLTSLNGKIITYIPLLSSNLSTIIFVLAALSILYISLFKRNAATFFWGLLFIVYYFFIVSDVGGLSPRFSLAFYPTIAVYSALFISDLIKRLKWKHAFKLCFTGLAIYLIVISSVMPLNNRFLSVMNKKLYYFPTDKAMMWVKNNIADEERILIIRILSSGFYVYKYSLNNNNIANIIYNHKDVDSAEKLKSYCKEQNISYIMFPYNAFYTKDNIRFGILDYLEQNPNNEFTKIEQFNIKDNFIYIYKTKNEIY